MTKQEKIKEAWGEYYYKIKNELDEHGRYNYFDLDSIKRKYKLWQFENIETNQINNLNLLIPSSIKGIETNNGWIKIESEEQRFPDEDLWICNFNGNKQPFIHDAYDFIPEKYTHYQPIEKPELPIY